MKIRDVSLAWQDARFYEVQITNAERARAEHKLGAISPSVTDKPSVWLRWLADLAEANNQ